MVSYNLLITISPLTILESNYNYLYSINTCCFCDGIWSLLSRYFMSNWALHFVFFPIIISSIRMDKTLNIFYPVVCGGTHYSSYSSSFARNKHTIFHTCFLQLYFRVVNFVHNERLLCHSVVHFIVVKVTVYILLQL